MSKENVHLTFVGTTESRGGPSLVLELTGRLEWDEWEKIRHLMKAVVIHDKIDQEDEEPILTWITFFPIEVEKILGISGKHTLGAQLISGAQNWDKWATESKDNADRRRREIILDGRMLCSRHPDSIFYPDMSWDSTQQRVGTVVDSSEYWEIHEYLFYDHVVGNCIKARRNNPVGSFNVVPGLMVSDVNTSRMAYASRECLIDTLMGMCIP